MPTNRTSVALFTDTFPFGTVGICGLVEDLLLDTVSRTAQLKKFLGIFLTYRSMTREAARVATDSSNEGGLRGGAEGVLSRGHGQKKGNEDRDQTPHGDLSPEVESPPAYIRGRRRKTSLPLLLSLQSSAALRT